MTWVTISLSAGTLIGMAVIMTYILGWANKAFHVEVDPRVEAINGALPGANCGGCGYVGCGEYAEAVALDNAEVNLCTVGGSGCAADIASIMGVDVVDSLPYRPIVHCGAHYPERLQRNEYRGEQHCQTANIVAGVQGCTYGCLGFGDCVNACKYNAIHVVDGLATVDYNKCIGCGACAKVCPRNIISMVPFRYEQMLAVTCSNKDFGKEVKNVCTVGCIGCKACQRNSDFFTVENNLSTVNYDTYESLKDDGVEKLKKAIDKCPRKGIVLMGKPTESDILSLMNEDIPKIAEPDFKTTVDDTEWRG
ncbi:MAG: RnfABCDGE type electron transport complex subunit B [Candidatus Magnetomorum sp.]|nr:RnfABCDGE type electron transport complex subunit B [Candidatus Magnetomorum sp.]